MTTSDSVQAAQGKVKVHREKDGNTLVKVEVERLAPPSVVQEDSVAYVVWLQPSGGQPQNVGTLKVDGRKLKGDLETKTPFKNFEVSVTAERAGNVTQPTGPEVMDAQITVPT